MPRVSFHLKNLLILMLVNIFDLSVFPMKPITGFQAHQSKVVHHSSVYVELVLSPFLKKLYVTLFHMNQILPCVELYICWIKISADS